ncbi:MAG: sulfite exporter TauE/SafE family protein [Actinomycetota bacterium]|nr:sulfite exporter TauE/SafE family protein [Actinomycetota bacterium]
MIDVAYLWLIPVGLIVGGLSAIFGIGGGLLMVPVMVLGYGIDQHAAQGTALAVIVPTALVGAIAHHRRGFVDLRLAAAMALGGTLSVYLGADLALRIEPDLLQRIFGGVVIAVGVRLVLQGRERRQSAAK